MTRYLGEYAARPLYMQDDSFYLHMLELEEYRNGKTVSCLASRFLLLGLIYLSNKLCLRISLCCIVGTKPKKKKKDVNRLDDA
jgi:hypothetical protein